MRFALLVLLGLFGGAPLQQGEKLSGYVLETTTGRPISGAEIAIYTDRYGERYLVTKSDSAGYFNFDSVAPGQYLVGVAKDGYISERYRESRRWLAVTVGVRTDLVLRLQGTGTLSGRILDPNGRPSPQARVRVFRFTYNDVQREPSGVELVAERSTDDRGEYRLFSIPAGSYFLLANSLNDGSAVLYPGAREFSQAQRIEVRPDTETRLLDVALPVPFAGGIRIHIVNATGAALPTPFSNRITAVPAGWVVEASSFVDLFVGNSLITPPGVDKVFRPRLIGSYVLYTALQTAAGNVAGYAKVDYSGGDIDVDFNVGKLEGQIKGRVLLETGESTKPLARAEIEFYGASAESSFSDKDGLFNIKGLLSGPFKFSGSFEMPTGYYVATVRERERDLLTEPLMVSATTPEVEVRVRSDGGSMEGKVTDSRLRAAPNAVVALVPQSLLETRSDRHNTYRVDHSLPKGEFELKDIIPGQYLIYAWANLEESAVMDPLFMARYAGKGLLVKVERGAKLKMDLTILDE